MDEKTIGRPRKYFGESKHSTKTFYFPSNLQYDLIWNEFKRIGINNNSMPDLFVKTEQYIAGYRLRRMILVFVLQNSRSENVRQVALNLLLVEVNSSIKAYNKCHSKQYDELTLEDIKNKYLG